MRPIQHNRISRVIRHSITTTPLILSVVVIIQISLETPLHGAFDCLALHLLVVSTYLGPTISCSVLCGHPIFGKIRWGRGLSRAEIQISIRKFHIIVKEKKITYVSPASPRLSWLVMRDDAEPSHRRRVEKRPGREYLTYIVSISLLDCFVGKCSSIGL
jgi:hypothetical protein